MLKDYLDLATKNVRKRGIRSWLTMLGIFIGIAAVVSLISLGSGLQNAITGQFSTLDPDKLVITNAETGFGPPGATAIKKLSQHDLDIINRVNGIDVVVQRLIRVASFEYNEITGYEYIVNIPEDSKQIKVIYDTLNVGLESGRLLSSNDRNKVVLGSDFTNDDYGKAISVGKRVTIQGRQFQVVGILKKASSFQINNVILMSDEDMRNLLDIGDEFDILVVQVKDRSELSKIKNEVERALRRDRNLKIGEEDFSVQTPEQSIQTINTILGAINLVIGGIAAISLLVGGIGITNTMYTSVLERTREIGVMKAIGAKNKDILAIFVTESSILGFVGGVIGIIIGLFLAFAVSYAMKLFIPGIPFDVTISFPLVLFSLVFSLVIGGIAGIFPAIQASNLRPVEALRA
ncbi:MAG: ABC transporter permease [Nanoarchaeota archaeon]